MLSDLDWVVSVERDGANLPFITPWERPQHEGAIRFPDSRHFILEGWSNSPAAGTGSVPQREAALHGSRLAGGQGDELERIGFLILQGCRNPNGSVELKRLVLQPKGRGLGRAAVRQLKAMVFTQLKAHRFWLDVKSLNTRALSLYQGEGFVEEGRLRESVRITSDVANGYDSLIVMSLLDREYQARVALGLEAA
ncbi:MAG: N-acetyltransferase [Rubrivivax sp.]|nr:MAG: N-acetyltransferase [Rubrivivax sp.]